MGYAAAPFEWKYKVSAGLGHHGQAVLVRPEDSDLPGADPVHCKDIKASIPIQGIICLLKVKESLLNRRLTPEIKIQDLLHGFRSVQGIGTAALESNILQYLVAMREAVLFGAFFDLQKAYDALDRDRCLDILAV